MERELRYNPELKGNDVAALATLYADVFVDPPWCEYTCCPSCGEMYGRDTSVGDACVNCGDGLSEAYPQQATEAYIREELSKPSSRLYTVVCEGQLVGFGWGYVTDSQKYVQSKYDQDDFQQCILQSLEDLGITDFFYVSEIGISKSARGFGLGKQITSSLVCFGTEKGLPVILRTNYRSPMFWIASRCGLTPMFGRISDEQIVNFPDSINDSRVQLYKLP